MKILDVWERSKDFWFLLSTSLLFFLLRLPSLFEPYWYGDEGIYHVIGSALRNGRLLYSEIFDNKPPLLYLTYAMFNSDQFWVRLTSLVVGLLSVVVFFFLAKRVFDNKKAIYASTGIFSILFGIPYLEGNIANAENFMTLPILLGAYLLVSYRSHIKHLFLNRLFVVGSLLGIAFLFKIVAIFDFAAFFIFSLFLNFLTIKNVFKEKRFIKALLNSSLLILGFLIPVILTFLFFIINGAVNDFIGAAFSSNVGYVGHGNKFLGIPQGLLMLKIIFLCIFTILLFWQQKKFQIAEIFILLWFAFSLFNAFFSGRPYTHYLLTLLPSFSLMIGLIFTKKFKIVLPILIISVYLVGNNFWVSGYKKTFSYYENFILFFAGQKNVFAYQNFFDRKTPVDYQIAQFINSQKKDEDQIFIWGNNGQVYSLTNLLPPGKYIVEYHIVGYKDGLTNTKDALEKIRPRFIVVMPNVPEIPFSLKNYSHRININNVSIYEKVL